MPLHRPLAGCRLLRGTNAKQVLFSVRVSVPLRGVDCYLISQRYTDEVTRFRPLTGCGLLLQPSFRIKYYRRKVNGIN